MASVEWSWARWRAAPRKTPGPSQGSADKERPGSSRIRREQDVLRVVNQRPGITISQITEQLGVDAR
jgi:hypothetical protein